MSNRLENHYALLIGVGECDNPQWSLPVTVKDIQALKSVLIDPDWCGYVDDEQHIRLLYNETATKEAILSGLNWLKEKAASNSEATVIVYYSGHGWLNESTGKYFLVPHDSKTSLLAAEQFNETLKQIHAKRLLVIIDSCHAQGMVSRKDEPNKFKLPPNFIAKSLPEKIIQDFKSGKESAIFSSSTGAEQSWILPDNSMSIYTYHFLAALLGAGNEPGEQYVRISDLIEYLSETVSQTTQNYHHRQQTPIFDLNGTNFPIAFLHGAKGLSQNELNYLKQDPKQIINKIINNAKSSVKKEIIKTISEYLESGLFVLCHQFTSSRKKSNIRIYK
ncbi:MAG: caspase family protein [Gloeotrichia echinulata DEX184]|nr:caspase family protein [Gloeotrichia echinulata DEX184]